MTSSITKLFPTPFTVPAVNSLFDYSSFRKKSNLVQSSIKILIVTHFSKGTIKKKKRSFNSGNMWISVTIDK